MQKKIIFTFTILIALFLFSIFSINIYINRAGSSMCREEDFPKQAALVLGARVWESGEMSDIFKDRAKTALSLYNEGKVTKILVSGDHGQEDYDEVNAAKKYLLENNVKAEDIFLDHAGFDTYDSLYRAREIFKAESLVIVTQDFHLPRALYIANSLELEACGKNADIRRYRGKSARSRREFFAKIKAWLDVSFQSKPKYLGEEIPLSGSGLDTFD